MKAFAFAFVLLSAQVNECGIADRANNWSTFRPMKHDPKEYHLVKVKPYFHSAADARIRFEIKRVCGTGIMADERYDPKTGRGYRIICTEGGGQFLNGYISEAMARSYRKEAH